MIDYLKSTDDVIAIRIGGKLTRSDIDPLITRLQHSLQAHPQTHVYAEMPRFEGFEWSELGHYLGQALPMMGKLDRFGRVAFVSDQAWIRGAAKLESALLPLISYKTFSSDERDIALKWVMRGETAQ